MPLTDSQRKLLETRLGELSVSDSSAGPTEQAAKPTTSALSDTNRQLLESRLQNIREQVNGLPAPSAAPEELVFGFTGSIPRSAYDAGERNNIGNIFERPAAATRGFIRGIPEGIPTAIENYKRASVNPATQPPFEPLQQKLPDAIMRSIPVDTPVPLQFAATLPAAVAGFGLDTAREVATNPAEAALALIPVSPIGKAAGKFIGNTKLARGVKRAFTTPIGRKFIPDSELLQYTADELPKLTSRQRARYFKVRSNHINDVYKTSSQQSDANMKLLSKELDKKATEQSLAIRSKVPDYLRQESQHYRTLADAEIQPLANDNVPLSDLYTYIKDRHKDAPEVLAEVSARLGLNDDVFKEASRVGRVPQAKIGRLYVQAKEFGQELPSAVRSGVRGYSRDEYMIDKTIDSLFGFLNDKHSIDLSAANTHWRKWARVRDQLIKESRPWNISGTETALMSRRLKLLAQGRDPDNITYAQTITQGLFGKNAQGYDQLLGDVKRVVSQMNTQQKTKIAAQISNLEQTRQLEAFKSQINQIADVVEKRRRTMRWVIGLLSAGAIASAGYQGVKGAASGGFSE